MYIKKKNKMILDIKLNVRINSSNYKHYVAKGYSVNKCGDIIEVDVDDLPPKSHVVVKCQCQKCEKIVDVHYYNYVKQVKDSYYCCVKCHKYKLEESMIKIYGVKNAQFISSELKKDKIIKEPTIKIIKEKMILTDKQIHENILFKLNQNIGALCLFLKSKYNPEYLIYLNKNIPEEALEFKLSEKLYLFEHNYKETPKCQFCGDKNKYIDRSQGYRKTCSPKCASLLRKKTNLENYGVDNPMKNPEFVQKALIKLIPQRPDMVLKAKKTNMERYGVDNPMKTEEVKSKVSISYKSNPENKIMAKERGENFKNKSIEEKDEINKKRLETIISEWGSWELYARHVQEEISKTSQDKYGTKHFFNSSEVTKKRTESYSKQALDKFIKKLPDNITYLSREHNPNKTDYYYTLSCHKCNNEFIIGRQYLKDNYSRLCTICNPNTYGTSNGEKDMVNYILSLYKGESIIKTNNIISPLELDLYLPQLKIAFEYNGAFWHSDKYKDNTYHLNKLNMCEELGIRLFTIWEDDWLMNNYNIKLKIRTLFKEYFLPHKKEKDFIYLENINQKTITRMLEYNRNLILIIDKMFKINDPSKFGFQLLEVTEPILEKKIINKSYDAWNCGYEKWIYVV